VDQTLTKRHAIDNYIEETADASAHRQDIRENNPVHLQHQNWRNPYPLGSYSCGIPSQIASEILPYYSLHFIVSEGERGGDTTPTLGKETNYLLLTTIFSPSALFMGGVPCPNSFRCDQPILVREDYVRILSLIQSLLQWMGVLLWQALDKVFKTILFSLLRAPTYFSTSLTLPCWKNCLFCHSDPRDWWILDPF